MLLVGHGESQDVILTSSPLPLSLPPYLSFSPHLSLPTSTSLPPSLRTYSPPHGRLVARFHAAPNPSSVSGAVRCSPPGHFQATRDRALAPPAVPHAEVRLRLRTFRALGVLAPLPSPVSSAQVGAPHRSLAALGHAASLPPAVCRAKKSVAGALIAPRVGATSPPAVGDTQTGVALGQLVAPRVLALSRGAPVLPAERSAAVGEVSTPGGSADDDRYLCGCSVHAEAAWCCYWRRLLGKEGGGREGGNLLSVVYGVVNRHRRLEMDSLITKNQRDHEKAEQT